MHSSVYFLASGHLHHVTGPRPVETALRQEIIMETDPACLYLLPSNSECTEEYKKVGSKQLDSKSNFNSIQSPRANQ